MQAHTASGSFSGKYTENTPSIIIIIIKRKDLGGVMSK